MNEVRCPHCGLMNKISPAPRTNEFYKLCDKCLTIISGRIIGAVATLDERPNHKVFPRKETFAQLFLGAQCKSKRTEVTKS